MEARGGDAFILKDDHNHNYRSSRSSKVSGDSRAAPGLLGREADTQRGKVWTVDLGGSDSSSESSEVSETDCTALSATAEGKFTLESAPKLRESA